MVPGELLFSTPVLRNLLKPTRNLLKFLSAKQCFNYLEIMEQISKINQSGRAVSRQSRSSNKAFITRRVPHGQLVSTMAEGDGGTTRGVGRDSRKPPGPGAAYSKYSFSLAYYCSDASSVLHRQTYSVKMGDTPWQSYLHYLFVRLFLYFQRLLT